MLKNDQMNNLECTYTIIGDTGEKDEEAGERIAKKYGAAKLKAIFLHQVSDNVDRSRFQLPNDRIAYGVPIYYFRTYVGAANKAYKNKLITYDGLTRVISAARKDLDNLEEKEMTKPKNRFMNNQSPAKIDLLLSRRSELEADISDALGKKKVLTFQGTDKPIAMIFPRS